MLGLEEMEELLRESPESLMSSHSSQVDVKLFQLNRETLKRGIEVEQGKKQ